MPDDQGRRGSRAFTALRDDGLIQWARLYAEPVEEGGADIVEAVQAMVAGSA